MAYGYRDVKYFLLKNPSALRAAQPQASNLNRKMENFIGDKVKIEC